MDLARLRINKSIFSSLGILQIPIFGRRHYHYQNDTANRAQDIQELLCYLNSV